MAFVDCLREVVEDCYQQAPDAQGILNLKEKSVMKLQLSGLGSGTVALRIEKLGFSRFLKGGKWQSTCDFAIVCPENGVIRVLFVEMKETLREGGKGFEQLRRSLPKLEYLKSLCRIHCGNHLEKVFVRYALVTAKGGERLDKQPVKYKSQVSVERHKGITVSIHTGEHVDFSRLWG